MARLSLPIRRPQYVKGKKGGSSTGSSSRSSNSSLGCLTIKSWFTLITGLMIGYLIVPLFIADTILPKQGSAGVYIKSKLPGGGISSNSSSGGNVRSPRSAAQETAEERIIKNQQFLSSQSVPTAATPHIIETKKLPDALRKRIMVTGGAGFVGSHLVDKLMGLGHEVIVVDNFFTGQKKNIEHWLHHPNFR